ncbi:DNA glycosylase [Hyaloscypha variabilis F]|uniref:DNA glycosylase n=1 Tax=Hyaloscypha variabilis (strain UAMH 11265 / GT02V1 / F) TaxID=1149755 RepID=A0A2J6RAA9_HYAVF|nr:DNA glycosylase [Hyaloscypha variabilis F]
MPRVTRAAAKREASFLKESLGATCLSSPPATPIASYDKTNGQPASLALINTKRIDSSVILPSPNPSVPAKRKRVAKNTATEPVSGGWDVLPHGLGKKGDLADGASIDRLVPNNTQPAPTSKRTKHENVAKEEDTSKLDGDRVKAEDSNQKTNLDQFLMKHDGPENDNDQQPMPYTPVRGIRGSRRRTQAAKIEVEEGDVKDEDFNEDKPKKKRTPRTKKALDTSEDALDKVEEPKDASGSVMKRERKKKHRYGLTPGHSPFPDHAMPTAEACEEVNRLLSELHGVVEQPKVVPPPSMDVTGCGEVPDLLDAILRTKLSASTTANNANLSLKGLKDTFGLRTSGVGEGSVNWEAVHDADLSAVIESIKSGGLAKTKGTDIKKILDMVYERNLARRDELLKESETGEQADILGADHETQRQKDAELAKFDETLLTMDHVFEMTTDEAMEEITKLPGIGVKTASCVILFCMKRPSFAVDTHVWRHCKWLGWVPEKATRDQTFSHCEVRVPDHLKYSLHQLFLRHGKTCGRCRANTSAGTKEWGEANCPIEHLVSRKEARKQPGGSPNKKMKLAAGKAVKGKKGKKIYDDGDFEESDVSDTEVEDDLTNQDNDVEAGNAADVE